MNLLFAWRYFKSKKSTNAINIIAWISVLAMLVGTTALIVVLSVFNGFEGLVKGLYGDFYADIRISASTGKYIEFNDALQNSLKNIAGVRQVSYCVEEKSVLLNGNYQTILFLKGVDSNYIAVNNMVLHTVRGSYELGDAEHPKIYTGAGIANAVGANPDMPFEGLLLYLPNRNAPSFTSMDAMLSYEVFPSGIFAVQQEFDDKYAFTNLGFMQYMLDLDSNSFSSSEIKLLPDADVNAVKTQIQKIVGTNYHVETRFEQNQSLFTIMQVEKWVIYAILSLILVVAAFNMIGALTMLVLEKEKDIAVLQAMGAGRNRIQKIFLNEGMLLASIGSITGIVLAFFICWMQQTFHLIKLGGGSFIIDYYPVEMKGSDFLLVAATVFLVSLLASWVPARKASAQAFSLKS